MCVHSVTDIVLETKCVHMYKIRKKFCILNKCIGTIHCSSIQMFGNFVTAKRVMLNLALSKMPL